MRIGFITSTPLNITRGSGTFAGIHALASALEKLGNKIEIVSPRMHFPVYTLERLWFNETLRRRDVRGFDLIAGFDMDGYRIAGRFGIPHIASIKGVIADEAAFERGLTRATMRIQALCERAHVRRAHLVITTSQYSASRIEKFYGVRGAAVVPELINLDAWQELFRANAAEPDPHRFTVLCVGRFYRRKRLDVLLRAAERLREAIPGLEVRLAGGGPEEKRLLNIIAARNLGGFVRLLRDIPQSELAREYNRCDLFCMPSVQEGFGIVFLEAMAAGKPIVAARAAATPEVLPQGLLVEAESDEALAEGLLSLYADPAKRACLAAGGLERVKQFDAPVVARKFLGEVAASRK